MKSLNDEIVERALTRQSAGLPLSREEAAALRAWERAERERVAWEVYAAIPKRHYVEMSGRQVKVINEQADKYGLPALLGPTVDLRALLRQFHDFLARHARQFAAAIDEEAVMAEGLVKGSPAAERYRSLKADMAELDRDRMRGELLPRAETREALGQVASVIRLAGERLEREHGRDARLILDEALDEAEAGIDAAFGAEPNTGD